MSCNELVESKISKAMMNLLRFHPFYYFFLNKISKKLNPNMKYPARVFMNRGDCRICMEINPLFLEKSSVEDIEILLEHEIGHLMFRHMDLAHGYNQKVFNQATDFIINDNIKKLVDRYPELMDKHEKLNKHIENSAKLGIEIDMDTLIKENWLVYSCIAPKIKHIVGNAKVGKMAFFELAPLLSKNSESVEDCSPMDDHSSGEGDSSGDGENHENGSENNGEHKIADIKSINRAIIDKYVLEANKECVEKGQFSRDYLPDYMTKYIDSLNRIKRDFANDLCLFATSVEGEEIEKTWSRRNKKYPDICKGSRVVPIAKILVCIDTSGSMYGDKTLKLISRALNKLSDAISDFDILFGDTVLRERYRYCGNGINWKKITWKGGGGTDLQFAWDAARKEQADGLIVFTDGYIGDFKSKGIPTLFCLPKDGHKIIPKFKNIIISD